MCISVHSNLLLHDGPEVFLALDRDPRGFEDAVGMRELMAQGIPTALPPVADVATDEELICNG
jgi:hypothetical protein